MYNLFKLLGETLTNFFLEWGRISVLAQRTLICCLTTQRHWRRSIRQMRQLGIKSIPIMAITSIFVGMSFGLQIVNEFLKFGASDMIGGVVGLAFWRELGPMMTGVVFAGRVGAAISAEIGSMKVTEQIEALEAMSQDPVEFLVLPRVIACTFIMPLLVGVSDILGFFSGFGVAVASGRVNPFSYINSAENMLVVGDITGGLFKALLFGIIISLISCHFGLNAKAGARGVGEITTKAVVLSLISVFILNYIISLGVF